MRFSVYKLQHIICDTVANYPKAKHIYKIIPVLLRKYYIVFHLTNLLDIQRIVQIEKALSKKKLSVD